MRSCSNPHSCGVEPASRNGSGACRAVYEAQGVVAVMETGHDDGFSAIRGWRCTVMRMSRMVDLRSIQDFVQYLQADAFVAWSFSSCEL